MDFFSDSLGRLKHYLRVSKDQEVAAALGLSKTAFSERKKRNSFPEKELRALAQQRPELGINVEYVLTGEHRPAQERLPHDPYLEERLKVALDEEGTLRPAHEALFTYAERDVVALWRRCSLADQVLAQQMLELLAARRPMTNESTGGLHDESE